MAFYGWFVLLSIRRCACSIAFPIMLISLLFLSLKSNAVASQWDKFTSAGLPLEKLTLHQHFRLYLGTVLIVCVKGKGPCCYSFFKLILERIWVFKMQATCLSLKGMEIQDTPPQFQREICVPTIYKKALGKHQNINSIHKSQCLVWLHLVLDFSESTITLYLYQTSLFVASEFS